MKYFMLFLLSLSLSGINFAASAQEVDDLSIDYTETDDLNDSEVTVDFEEDDEKTEKNDDSEEFSDEDATEKTVVVQPVSNFRKGEMDPSIANRIKKAAAIENLMHPEQVFCYRVNNMPDGYTGYTLNGFALMSFCGVLNRNAIDVIIEQLFSRGENVSSNVENCRIKPQVILRFIRGIDSTDILLSSPCHSYTVFYATERQTFNLSPIAGSLDYLIGSFNNVATEFVSPALLGQLAASGVAQNDEQKALIENTRGPLRLWEQKKAQETQKKTGWNKLKK